MHRIAHGKADLDGLRNYYAWNDRSWQRDAYRMTFVSNHDKNAWEGTEYEQFGDALDAAIVLSVVGEGIPLVYNGQEAGSDKRLEFFAKDLITWRTDPQGDLYRRLFALKKAHPALWNGASGGRMVRIPNDVEAAVLSFFREMDGDQVLGVFNLSAEEVTVSLTQHPLGSSATDALSGDAVDLCETADVAGVGLPRDHLRLVASAPPARPGGNNSMVRRRGARDHGRRAHGPGKVWCAAHRRRLADPRVQHHRARLRTRRRAALRRAPAHQERHRRPRRLVHGGGRDRPRTARSQRLRQDDDAQVRRRAAHPHPWLGRRAGPHAVERPAALLRRLGFVMGQRWQLHPDIPVLESFELHRVVYDLDRDEFLRHPRRAHGAARPGRPRQPAAASSAWASGCGASSSRPCCTARRSSSSTSPPSGWTSTPSC